VTGVAVHDHGKLYGLRDPPCDSHAFQHGERAHIGEPCIAADYSARANKTNFTSSFLHDSRASRVRRMQDRQHPVGSIDQLPQTRGWSNRIRSFITRSHARSRPGRRKASLHCAAIDTFDRFPLRCNINEMMFHCMERRRSCLRHRPRPRPTRHPTSSSRRSASTTPMKARTAG
jgi:hypothetical protein